MSRYIIERGTRSNGQMYEHAREKNYYRLSVDGAFWSTCESHSEAMDELKTIEKESAKVTRLAFNLFTDGTPTAYRFDENNRDLPVNDDDRREAALFSVSDIFCCEYAAYFFEAIKLRYPEYFHNP